MKEWSWRKGMVLHNDKSSDEKTRLEVGRLFRMLGKDLFSTGHYKDSERFVIRFVVSDVVQDLATLEKKRTVLLGLIPYYVEEKVGEYAAYVESKIEEEEMREIMITTDHLIAVDDEKQFCGAMCSYLVKKQRGCYECALFGNMIPEIRSELGYRPMRLTCCITAEGK